MLWIDVIGILGSVAIAISFFPQTYTSIKKKSVNGLSIKFILLILCASISMDIYSFYYQIIPMIIANVCVTLNSLVLVSLYLIEHQVCGLIRKENDDSVDLEFV